jgi:carboxyl-terminal processing protease
MIFPKRNTIICFISAVLFFFSSSCSNNDITEEYIVNSEIYKMMKDIYLWYEYIPEVNIGSFETPYELIEYIRYKPLDKWSYVMTKDEYLQYFEEGEMIGHGFLLGIDSSGRIRISFLYKSTEAFEKGIRRGWIVDKVNDVVITQYNFSELIGPREIGIRNKFEFINLEGKNVIIYLIKKVLDITPVLHHEIISSNNKHIGYIVFQDFIDAAISEIDNVFTEFKSKNIDELIVDLRYNSGGNISVAEYISGWIAGNSYSNSAFVKFIHNNKHPELDTVVNIPYNESGFVLERIFFIGTNSTASASELLINGLKPYMEVILIGNNTHGKPVGMYALTFEDYNYAVLPVCFKFTNGNDAGDFYDGLVPDSYAEDDITRNFGDPGEECLEETLNIIETGIPSIHRKKVAKGTYLLETEKQKIEFLKAY